MTNQTNQIQQATEQESRLTVIVKIGDCQIIQYLQASDKANIELIAHIVKQMAITILEGDKTNDKGNG